jgi:23S rRNA pseudouridine1911/1915/1917 synthase
MSATVERRESGAAVRQTVTADRGDDGCRLDLVLRRHLHHLRGATRTRIQAWINAGQVAVDGRIVRRTASRVAAGHRIALDVAEPSTRLEPAPEAIPLDILYEDDWLMAIDKPAGLVTHPAYKHPGGTLLNGLLWRARSWPPPQRPSLLGRLDKHTSGVLVVAKTREVHARLQRELTGRQAVKDYLAVVYGRVRPARGSIAMPLSRDPRDRRRVVVASSGRPSVTLYERLASYQVPRTAISLLRCRLQTGRMHQIRVHLAARGWPLVGDPLYGASGWTEIADPRLSAIFRAFKRQALHAWHIGFTHPMTGRGLHLEAPLSEDLNELLGSLDENRHCLAVSDAVDGMYRRTEGAGFR